MNQQQTPTTTIDHLLLYTLYVPVKVHHHVPTGNWSIIEQCSDQPMTCHFSVKTYKISYLKSYAYGRLASADLCPPHTVIFIWIFTLNVRLLTNINRRAFTFPCIILFLYTITELTESLLLWLKTLQRASSVCYHDLPAFNYCFNGLFFSSCQNPAINFIAWRQYIHHIFLCSGKTLKYDAVSVDQFSVW